MNHDNFDKKASSEEIEQRFDNDVERFANLETGQTATMDAPLAMELITEAAVAASSPINSVLDIGCGAGNNTLKLLQCVEGFDCDLVDLSENMIDRAHDRVAALNSGRTRVFKGDIRSLDLVENSYDVILAAAVLHHLRDDEDWKQVFSKLYRLLLPGGSVWITDLVSHESAKIHDMMRKRYGDYLVGIGGEEYRDLVLEYIEKEDSPRAVMYQLELLREVGFTQVELLHKNSCFAAFGAIK
jgi:tRNA (cmo5U34)-methyltransferase